MRGAAHLLCVVGLCAWLAGCVAPPNPAVLDAHQLPERSAQPDATPHPGQMAQDRLSAGEAPAAGAGEEHQELKAQPDGVLLGSGLASWYGARFQGRRTASGERFDRDELTAAHRTLPFGARVCVRSLVNGRAVVVRINDRGPFSPGRVIDLSEAAAQELGMLGLGIKPVELRLLEAQDDACPGAQQQDDDLQQRIEAAGEVQPAPRVRNARRHTPGKKQRSLRSRQR